MRAHNRVPPFWRLMAGGLMVVVMATLAPAPASAGRLDAFEQSATGASDDGSNQDDADDESLSDHVVDVLWTVLGLNLLMEALFDGVESGGQKSGARIGIYDVTGPQPPGFLREPGETLIPFFAVDVNRQNVESDVTATDVRAEVGYAMFGAQWRHTRFEEKFPADRLSMDQAHLLYRMSFSPRLETDFGIGVLVLDGNNYNSGSSMTLPIRFRVNHWISMEFRPAWGRINGNQISDHDISVTLTRRHAGLRIGYRDVDSGGGNELKGPYAGVSFQY